MRIDVRQWAIGLTAAGCVAAAAAFLQPWLTHWMVVFTWHSPFCGSADDGEVLPVNYTWTVWWTATSIVGGAAAGRLAARGRTRAVDARLRLAMVVAAAAGSLTVVAALHGLVGISASAGPQLDDLPTCLELSAFVPMVIWGMALGSFSAAAALQVKEIAIGLGCGWLLVWAGNVLIGIDKATRLHHYGHAGPLDVEAPLRAWMSWSAAENLTTAVVLTAIPLAGLLAYWITRSGPRSVLAALSVHLLLFVSSGLGNVHYRGIEFFW